MAGQIGDERQTTPQDSHEVKGLARIVLGNALGQFDHFRVDLAGVE